MQIGLDVLGTVENESESAKYKNWTGRPQYDPKLVRECKTCKRDPTSSVRPKTSPGAQNMKTGPDALCSAENESGSAKHENETWGPRFR
jgi:hypothetical protein